MIKLLESCDNSVNGKVNAQNDNCRLYVMIVKKGVNGGPKER